MSLSTNSAPLENSVEQKTKDVRQHASFLALTTVVLAVIATPALAQDSVAPAQSAVLRSVLECRTIEDQAARLSCYDAATSSLETATRQGDVIVVDQAQIRDANRQLFGFTVPTLPNFMRQDGDDGRIDEIESTLVRAAQGRDQRWVFTLADGSVWRQTDSSNPFIRTTEGTPVRVRRASLGSYLITVGPGRAIGVRRE